MSEDTELVFDWTAIAKKPSENSDYNFILLYGPPGGGKTYTAATIAQLKDKSPVVIIDTEGSTVGSLKSLPSGDDDIVILPVSTAAGFDMTVEAFYDGTLNKQFGKEFKTLIIDTFDVAQERKRKQLEEVYPDDGFAMWREVGDWAMTIAQNMRDDDTLGIMVIHNKRDQSDTGALVDQLAMVGGSKDKIPGLPDVVAYVERDEGVTYAHFESSKNRVSKNRHGFPAIVADPNLADLYEAFVRNGGKGVAEPVEEIKQAKIEKPASKTPTKNTK